MKPSVTLLLEEAKKKMSGYVALLNYRFANLSVKAQAEALLSVTVSAGGETMPLERASLTRNVKGREDQFEVYPRNRSLLAPVLSGFKCAHPEYKLELNDISGSEDAEGVKDQYILATVPEVDDSRHSELTQAVNSLSDGCKKLLEMTRSYYSDQLKLVLDGAPQEEQDEASDALQDLYKRHEDLCGKFRSNKEQEIEAAHSKYKEKNASHKQKEGADNGASSQAVAGMRMKWTEDDD